MKNVFLVLFCFITSLVSAQAFYNMDKIQTIEITFAQSNWDQLLDQAYAADAGYILAQSVKINGEGYFLTDNETNLTKWTFPAGATIEPNGYLIIWADEDGDQAGLHANFKLSASAESIILVDHSGKTVDAVSYTDQVADISFGRFPNGTGDFRPMTPTYNATNVGTVSAVDAIEEKVMLRAYPNPTNGTFYLEINNNKSNDKLVSIYSISGTLVYQNRSNGNLLIDGSQWKSGMYIVRVENA